MHRMHSSASISERKFAEKLTILLERGQGILTRVYNIKKVSIDGRGGLVGGIRSGVPKAWIFQHFWMLIES